MQFNGRQYTNLILEMMVNDVNAIDKKKDFFCLMTFLQVRTKIHGFENGKFSMKEDRKTVPFILPYTRILHRNTTTQNYAL